MSENIVPGIDPVEVIPMPGRDLRLLPGEDEYSRRPFPESPQAIRVASFAFAVYGADGAKSVHLDVSADVAAMALEQQPNTHSLHEAAAAVAATRGRVILREDYRAEHGAP